MVDSAISQIVNAIINRSFKPGDKIPTEAMLAEQFGIGRNSVREAVKVLVSYGILEIRRAEGTFVCSQFSPQILNPLIYGIILENNEAELVQLRKTLSYGTWMVAVHSATKEDIAQLKLALDKLIAELSNSSSDVQKVLQLDCDFHHAISMCSHNSLLVKFNDTVALLLTQIRLRNITGLLSAKHQSYLIDLHTRIYEAIKDKNYDDISFLIKDQLRSYQDVLQNNWG